MRRLEDATFWIGGGEPKRRPRHPVGGKVACEECPAILDYEYGSPVWRCQERDLCPECCARIAVAASAKSFRAALAEQEARDA